MCDVSQNIRSEIGFLLCRREFRRIQKHVQFIAKLFFSVRWPMRDRLTVRASATRHVSAHVCCTWGFLSLETHVRDSIAIWWAFFRAECDDMEEALTGCCGGVCGNLFWDSSCDGLWREHQKSNTEWSALRLVRVVSQGKYHFLFETDCRSIHGAPSFP
jgi:hypothetical protein